MANVTRAVAADRIRIVDDLKMRWYRHANLYRAATPESSPGAELAAMRSYAKAIAVVLDVSYRDVERSLNNREL